MWFLFFCFCFLDDLNGMICVRDLWELWNRLLWGLLRCSVCKKFFYLLWWWLWWLWVFFFVNFFLKLLCFWLFFFFMRIGFDVGLKVVEDKLFFLLVLWCLYKLLLFWGGMYFFVYGDWGIMLMEWRWMFLMLFFGIGNFW